MEKIYFGGGCFWCTEAVFSLLKGVKEVTPGYIDGHVQNPTYRDVCTGFTGHNEVIEVLYNPDLVSLKQLLFVFFTSHDPTTLNRQGNDVGTQYRSGIYCTTDVQLTSSQGFILNEAAEIWDDPIVTEVKEASEFYPAEDYHQDYFKNNGQQGYCRIIIEPKVLKVKKHFQNLLKDE